MADPALESPTVYAIQGNQSTKKRAISPGGCTGGLWDKGAKGGTDTCAYACGAPVPPRHHLVAQRGLPQHSSGVEGQGEDVADGYHPDDFLPVEDR